MAARRQFLIIAYDIVSNRRRYRVEKLLKGYGRRANYSVFECRISRKDLKKLKKDIAELVSTKEDSILYYPLCRACEERREEIGFREKRKKKSGNLFI